MLSMSYSQTWPRNPNADEDAALVERALNEDLAAFEQLVTRYQDKITGFAARMLSDRDEAEDVAQEVFIKAYRHLESFRGASSFSTWLVSHHDEFVHRPSARQKAPSAKRLFARRAD